MGIQKLGSGLSIFSLVLFFLCGAGQICPKVKTASVTCHSQTKANPKPCDCPISKQEWQNQGEKENNFKNPLVKQSHKDSFFSAIGFPDKSEISEAKIRALLFYNGSSTPVDHFLESVKLLN